MVFDEETEEWCDWFIDTDEYYYDDVDDFCESEHCEQKEELEKFKEGIFKQIDWSKLP